MQRPVTARLAPVAPPGQMNLNRQTAITIPSNLPEPQRREEEKRLFEQFKVAYHKLMDIY